MKTTTKTTMGLVMLGAAALALGTVTGCKGSGEQAKAEAKAAINPLKVQVPTDLLSQISVGKPKVMEVTSQEKVAGRIETDAARVARIGSPVDGRITKVLVFEGQRVQRGQVLAMLHSNALSDTQFAFLKPSRRSGWRSSRLSAHGSLSKRT